MKIGIHQPNYIPWMGYFDKLDSCDMFIIMDDVQLTDSSVTHRNKMVNVNGLPTYLTVPFEKRGYMEKPIRDLRINLDIDWQKRQYDFLKGTYGKTKHWEELMQVMSSIFSTKYEFLYDVNMGFIENMRDILNINTKMLIQSEMDYNIDEKKGDLVLELCKVAGADCYLSGNGAKKYMNLDSFGLAGIDVEFQEFTHPVYEQMYSDGFIPGMSILDSIINCGIEKTKEMFEIRRNV